MDDIMTQRVVSLCAAILLAIGFLAAPAPAQQASSIAVVSNADQIQSLLAEGQQLEKERRWAEALAHYETAVRKFPHDTSLYQHFAQCRLHYDLSRRYADKSYCNAVGTLAVDKALDLYTQVLAKIDSHYVESPNWKGLVQHGTNNLDVALSESIFCDRNIPKNRQGYIDGFRQTLHQTLAARTIASRQDARDAVLIAASLGQRWLGVYPTAIVLEYLCGATNSLDIYSAYLTPNQLNEVYSQIEGNFVGLGVELKAEKNQLKIVRVIPGSPAQQGGIRAGDLIVSVNGQSTRDLSTDQAANLLQGKAGSMVRLVVTTPGYHPRELVVQRRRVDVPSIDQVKIVDREFGVAYLRLVCFQKTTCRDLEEALWKLHHQGMRSLIIDLRGNPGGLLVTSVETVDKFIERGVIVSTRGRSPQEDFTYQAHASGTWRVPLVVLIDGESASAAEIFSGAIRDHRRGTIVGEKSYGKGSVQGIFPLDVGSAGIRLTTAKFYSPSGHPFSRIGVSPHVPVHVVAKPAGEQQARQAKDTAMLNTAIQAARQMTQRHARKGA